jgi:hypothetical protein
MRFGLQAHEFGRRFFGSCGMNVGDCTHLARD